MNVGCRQSDYGNCGPKKDDCEYCLFHDPEKKGSERVEFYHKLAETNPTHREEISTMSLGQVSSKKRFVFEEAVDWRGYYFPKIPPITSDYPLFPPQAVFEDNADFSDAFLYLPAFFEAEFRGDVLFRGAEMFHPDFSGTVFEGVSDFSGATLHHADFNLATFEGPARFLVTQFEGPVDFSTASFGNECLFMGASFDEDLSFADVDYARGITILPVFGKYYQTGSFGVVDIDEDSRFGKESAKREACRVQRIAFSNSGLDREADEMFVSERRAHRRQLAAESSFRGKARAVAELVVADLSCRYGTSWLRVLTVSGGLVLLSATTYWAGDACAGCLGSLEANSEPLRVAKPGFYFYYSAVVFLALGSTDVSVTGILAYVSIVQSLIGAVLLALITAVFLRRWMR